MEKVLHGISKLIDLNDMFILVDTFLGIDAFSVRNSTNIQLLIDHGIVKSVTEHLSNKDLKIYASALQIIVKLQASGTKEQIQYLRDYRVNVRSEVHGSYRTYHEEF
uniref:Uncharacterized protein n=1 Tax=Panagrolaimus davidi TaxID=227884 RepID=A0A914P4D3_9BILA